MNGADVAKLVASGSVSAAVVLALASIIRAGIRSYAEIRVKRIEADKEKHIADQRTEQVRIEAARDKHAEEQATKRTRITSKAAIRLAEMKQATRIALAGSGAVSVAVRRTSDGVEVDRVMQTRKPKPPPKPPVSARQVTAPSGSTHAGTRCQVP